MPVVGKGVVKEEGGRGGAGEEKQRWLVVGKSLLGQKAERGSGLRAVGVGNRRSVAALLGGASG